MLFFYGNDYIIHVGIYVTLLQFFRIFNLLAMFSSIVFSDSWNKTMKSSGRGRKAVAAELLLCFNFQVRFACYSYYFSVSIWWFISSLK